MADAPGALADMDKSTDLYRDFTQTWVKKASVHMELGEMIFFLNTVLVLMVAFWLLQAKRWRPTRTLRLQPRSTLKIPTFTTTAVK